MPDWLQRPPAWRGMAVRELERRDLPPPDTSVIDPRTMLDIGDLPQWLQRIAARAEESGTTVTGVSEAETPPPAPTGPAATERPPDIAEPLSTSIQQQSPEIVLLPTVTKQAEEWWRSVAVLKGMAVLAVVLGILVWIILVAA